MTIFWDVLKELFKMFVADFRLTLATLSGVLIVGLLLRGDLISPGIASALLLVVCLIVLFEAVPREARLRRKK
ncbi:MAG: hypothetical protein QNL54_06345 [Rhodobacterales bacterium]